jgi:ABC-type antimicrobial peptide transport system permease subunit
VTQRRGEIGVRVALGAQMRHVTRLVLSQSLGLALIGVTAGIVAALVTTRVLSALLYGVAPTDPVTLVVVPVVLLGVALIASYLPARRAARTDPVMALRAE